jgi:hypothetical protein
MPSLQDALVNAKLATEKQAIKVEKKEVKQEVKKEPQQKHPRLQKQEFEVFEKIWEN